jgi:predicted nucleic acid-binding protein
MRALQDPRRADLLSDLDRGEAEVIALAQEISADLVVIDERLGRRHARRLGLRLTGTLGVLLKAKEQLLVTEIKPLVEQLQHGGIRLGDAVVVQALKLADEG